MDGIRYPVGELPPEVYWRRRIVAFVAIVLALVVLYYLVKGAASGKDPGPSESPGASPSVSPEVSPTIERACGVADLLITLAPTSRYFDSTDPVSLTATVTHTGLTDCVLDPGEASAELVITSGSDRIWSNLDCAYVLFTDAPTLLSPNKSVTLSATWPRIRSDETCRTGLNAPQPGTYHSFLTLNGAKSTDGVFSLNE